MQKKWTNKQLHLFRFDYFLNCKRHLVSKFLKLENVYFYCKVVKWYAMADFEFAVLNEFKQITTQIWVHWQENKKVFINFYSFLLLFKNGSCLPVSCFILCLFLFRSHCVILFYNPRSCWLIKWCIFYKT